jgi:hypothetical protein
LVESYPDFGAKRAIGDDFMHYRHEAPQKRYGMVEEFGTVTGANIIARLRR